MTRPPDGDSEERQLALLVTSAADYAIFMLDSSGHVLTWNPGAERMKGYARDDIVGRHFSVFYTEQDRARDHPADELRLAARDGRYEEEGWRVRQDGTTFWAGVTITAIRDEEGRLTGFAKVTRDLTERRQAEEERRRVVEDLRLANEELNRFASVAAHDMAGPLRTISGFAELLVNGDPAPEQARGFARHILTSSQRLSGLLQSLLDYSRAGRGAGERTSVDLAAAARDVVADMAGLVGERGAVVSVEVPDGAVVSADPVDVRLVLQNLLSNAVKFGAAAGPVVSVEASPADGTWNVVVADNGAGIAPEDQARIFEAFERGDGASGQDGHGLGLAICARLVARHGGTLELDSAIGSGSRFYFSLPAGEAAPA